jgi:septal ring-binding cell division protein DamX
MSDTKPPDASSEDFEALKEVEGELERLLSHPRSEARRLHAVAEEGESGTTPPIELATVATRVIPFVILMIGLIFGVYYLARR